MITKGFAAAVLVAGALTIAGCGSSTSAAPASVASTTEEATPTPTVSTPPADGGTYSTVVALKDAYVEAGGECPAFKQTNRVTLAAESAECSDTAVLSTYISTSDISQLIQSNKKMNEDLKVTDSSSWLVGENWVINSPDALRLQEKLGGRVVSF